MVKTTSLKKNYEFSRVYRNGRYQAGKYLVAYCLRNKKESIRLGVSQVKGFGNSVERNRAKRLIRESFRLMEQNIKTGYDIVFISRKREGQISFFMIQKEMKYLMNKLDLYIDET